MTSDKQTRALALDPSSTATGFCVAEVDESRPHEMPTLVQLGVLRPVAARERGKRTPAESAYAANERVSEMVRDVSGLLTEFNPQIVFVEIPTGKVHGVRKHAGGAGLSIYGLAVGRIYEACVRMSGEASVIPVAESDWTGSKPKDKRSAETEVLWRDAGRLLKQSRADGKDKGLDAADAAGLMLWVSRRFF